MSSDSGIDPADPIDAERQLTGTDGVERDVWEALRTVEDPELPVSVVDLGLIYDVSVQDGRAEIELTVTYSGCPGREMIVGDVEAAVRDVEGVESVGVSVVYSPPWSVELITDRGREQLAEFGLAVPGAEEEPDPDCHQ